MPLPNVVANGDKRNRATTERLVLTSDLVRMSRDNLDCFAVFLNPGGFDGLVAHDEVPWINHGGMNMNLTQHLAEFWSLNR